MSSFDVSTFLAAITDDQPCGDNLEYDPEFIKLETLAKGKPEQQIGDRIEPAEPPNWRDVRKAAEALLSRTRDLRVLIYFTRALLHTEGLSGFRDGLALTRDLLEKYWESIHPQLDPDDDNDPTERVNIMMSLCDTETVLRSLQTVPLVDSPALGAFSLRDYNLATGKLSAGEDEEPPTLSSLLAAFQDAGSEANQAMLEAVGGALDAVDAIENFITDQVGVAHAASFDALRSVLKEIRHSVAEHSGEAGGADEAAPEGEAVEAGAGPAVAAKGAAPAAVNSTDDVVKVLKLVCDYYCKHEPSSPIPILLERAMRLVGKDFMTVLNDLAPDGISQMEVIRGPMEEES